MWPDLADQVPVCDVAVCAHVVYNVPDLVPFATALTRHARRPGRRGADRHPSADPAGADVGGGAPPAAPDGPTAELAVAVLREAGLDPELHERVIAPVVRTGELQDTWVDFTRRQLCLPPERTPRGRGS